jgi:hypothetical protein
MHRSRAPSIAPGTFFVAQSWADSITDMPGFNLIYDRHKGTWGLSRCRNWVKSGNALVEQNISASRPEADTHAGCICLSECASHHGATGPRRHNHAPTVWRHRHPAPLMR